MYEVLVEKFSISPEIQELLNELNLVPDED
jgi:hypothetical protein